MTFITLLLSDFPVPQIEFNPERYICYRTTKPLTLDGRLDEQDWDNAKYTQSFVDIEGDLKPHPYLDTKVKMLWDDTNLYFGVSMEEPHIWATLTQRDTVIFYDNDFEIFLDPDGDTHNYYELEVNAYGTEWDLLLLKPYRDAHKVAVDSWDIAGLVTAIYIDGTLNNPNDIDKGWSIEIAIPWNTLEECSSNKIPIDGQQWRVNFSRVQWETDIINGKYIKKDKREHNWVWSPQGLIAMHYPEMWGFVQFSVQPVSKPNANFMWDTIENHKWYLRQMYYHQKIYFDTHRKWNDNYLHLKNLTPFNRNFSLLPTIKLTYSGYEIEAKMKDGRQIIMNHEGQVKVK